MVISENPHPSLEDFKSLTSLMLQSLKEESAVDPNKYLQAGGVRLEKIAYDFLTEHAVGTPFEGSITLKSGQYFPDIIAHQFYGIEVKTSKSNQWTSTGSSVAEGTREEDIERIFMLFGRLCNPIDFMCRPYEECLSEVVVTHSPRYLIDMRLKSGETIFDKMKLPYDELRSDNPIQKVLNYYRGKYVKDTRPWWLGGDEEERADCFITDMTELTLAKRRELISECFCLFPELLGRSHSKYKRVVIYLVSQGYVSSNLRDYFSAGGKAMISHNGKSYEVPKVVRRLMKHMDLIPDMLSRMNATKLFSNWGETVEADRLSQWVRLVDRESKQLDGINDFPLGIYLYDNGYLE